MQLHNRALQQQRNQRPALRRRVARRTVVTRAEAPPTGHHTVPDALRDEALAAFFGSAPVRADCCSGR